MYNENIERPEGFEQVCIWPGMIITQDEKFAFEEYFLAQGFKLLWLETITTRPDHDENGNVAHETGGRVDTFFAVHNDDVMKFAVPRLGMGIRWIEDVLENEARETEHSIYPDRVSNYRTW